MIERPNLKERPSISLFFPVYKDERTVRTVAEKAVALLEQVACDYEIIIIDDGSPDCSGQIADELAREYSAIKVIHHAENRGYGEAIKAGLAACRYDWICFTDGDDEYDVFDFLKLIRLRYYYDLIITFRYVRLYSTPRVFISRVYNMLVRMMFRTTYRDISTGLRMVRKTVLDEVCLECSSPFIGAELTIKLMLMGYRIGEVGIQTFPREFGRGSAVSLANIVATFTDLIKVRRAVFSKHYNLPVGRSR